MKSVDKKYLEPTAIIDSDHPRVIAYAMENIKGTGKDAVAKAVRLYYAVRDGIWYDPYYPFYLPEHYRASLILEGGRGFCVCKASLLCALGRACGIPTRVGFAHVRNHLVTRELLDLMGTDLFVYHGYTEFYLQEKWVMATPAFNRELCERHRVVPLEFNGHENSIFQPFNLERKKFMEYVKYVGSYDDIPVDLIVRGWEKAYGKERVRGWIREFQKTGGRPHRNFNTEEVLSS
ncbi:MAG: transglutaminase domain-containing protein [Deltaproteobacteria bacterium]|nr:transglutaminase domain-containing protein [Deltaproteobacteria bacterium]